MKKVTVYTTPTCVYCKMAKDFLTEHKVAFVEKDVVDDIAAQKEMIGKSQQLGVPVIDVEGTIVVGFDQTQLSKLLKV